MKVCIAEDDTTHRHLLEETLVDWGYDVITTADGDAAWEVFQPNDGPQLASVFVLVPDSVHWQMLYLPLARLVRALVPLGDPFEPLRLLGAFAGGVGVGASFLCARAFGAARRCALFGAALIGVSRYAWFFGSTVEVHSLHFAMVGVAACITLHAPWKRPWLALALSAAAYAATWTTHGTAVLLGPGWVALVGYARARVAPPFRARTLLFVVGPALLGALLAVMLPLKAWWVARTGGSASLEWDIVRGYAAYADRLRFLWDGLARPLGLALPLVVVGLAPRLRTPEGATLLLLLLPGSAFLLWWGVAEDGGYFLGHAPFHAVLVAYALGGLARRSALIASGLILLQGAATCASLRRFDARLHADERAALARETLGERGYLGKLAYLAPDVSITNPGLAEVDLVGRLKESFAAGVGAEELADALAPTLADIQRGAPVALDLSYASERWDAAGAEFPAYVDAFAAAVLARFDVERRERGGWTFALLKVR